MVQHKVAIIGEPDSSAEFAKIVRSEERYTVRFFSFSKEDIEWISQGLGSSAVLGIVKDDEEEQKKFVTSLTEADYLDDHPIVICSFLPDEVQTSLAEKFKRVMFLPLDVERKELLETLKDATEVAEPVLGEKGQQIVSIFEGDHFFAGLLVQDLGGSVLSNCPRKQALESTSRDYLPEDEEVLEIFSALEQELPEWAQARINRLAYVNHRIFKALKLTSDDVDLREASVLSSWALCHGGRGDARRDLTLPQSEEYREELGTHMGETAEEVMWELEREASSLVLRTVGLLVKRGPVQRDSKSYYPAAVILATDLIDRIVWQWDMWNPLAARKLLKTLMIGEFEDFPAYIICAVLKMLLEAVESVPPSFCMSPELIDDSEDRSGDTEIPEEDIVLPEGEARCSISYLKPGLKLTRSVYTRDGLLAVEGGVVLDADMVWRIWSLASTRLLRDAPIISVGKNEQVPPPAKPPFSPVRLSKPSTSEDGQEEEDESDEQASESEGAENPSPE